jgi:uracil-DNA glycosylase
MSRDASQSLAVLNEQIITCRKCPRLVKYREEVARIKRRAYREQPYWGRPVPGFGDAHAELLIIGLAPAAHGANRTGRMFTGDRSGDFLYAQLHRAGFASRPASVSRDDGLVLRNAYISAVARCAPPHNKPTPQEILNCARYLEAEIAVIKPRAVLALGHIAWNQYLRMLARDGRIERAAKFHFSHGASCALPDGLPRLFGSYHPSQQNTQTGRLTPAMFASVLKEIRRYLTGHKT